MHPGKRMAGRLKLLPAGWSAGLPELCAGPSGQRCSGGHAHPCSNKGDRQGAVDSLLAQPHMSLHLLPCPLQLGPAQQPWHPPPPPPPVITDGPHLKTCHIAAAGGPPCTVRQNAATVWEHFFRPAVSGPAVAPRLVQARCILHTVGRGLPQLLNSIFVAGAADGCCCGAVPWPANQQRHITTAAQPHKCVHQAYLAIRR